MKTIKKALRLYFLNLIIEMRKAKISRVEKKISRLKIKLETENAYYKLLLDENLEWISNTK